MVAAWKIRLPSHYALIQHHLGEASQIVGSGEHAGMARHAAHIAGGFIVDHGREWAAPLAGSSSVGAIFEIPLGRRQEAGVLHSERLEDFVAWRTQREFSRSTGARSRPAG